MGDIVFFRQRGDMVQKYTRDVHNSTQEICSVVSGFELPAETVLANKRAIERGIAIRVLIQELGGLNPEMLSAWEQMGMKIRAISLVKGKIYCD